MREREKERSPVYWVTKCLQEVELAQVEARSLGTQSESPTWMAKTQLLQPSCAVSQGVHKQESVNGLGAET